MHTHNHTDTTNSSMCAALSHYSVPDMLGMLISTPHIYVCMQVRFARSLARTHARTLTSITHCLSHRYPQLKNSRNELEFGYTVSRNFCLSR